MTEVRRTERSNQKNRTRKQLLQTASQLMRQGRRPTIEEIAEQAMVSRATAYRYFPNVESLLVEASLDIAVPEPGDLFGNAAEGDLVSRLERVDSALNEAILANEAALRTVLVHSLQQRLDPANAGLPARQNRRTPLIEAALAAAGPDFDPAALQTLAKALALIVGTEAVLVCKDVLDLDDAEARRIRHWAIRALVDAARRPPAPK